MIDTEHIDWDNPAEQDHPLLRNTLFWWPTFGERFYGGSVVRDMLPRSSKAGVTGTPTNGQMWRVVNGRPCLRLTQASSQAITAAGASRVISGLSAVTLAAWVYPLSYSGSFPMLVEYGADAVVTNRAFNTYYASSGGPPDWTFTIRNTAPSQVFFAEPVAGRWHRVAICWNLGVASNCITYWLNGVRQTTGGTATVGTFGTHTLYFGARAGSSLFFDCALADIRMAGRALTDNEVAEDYSETRRGYPTLLRRIRQVAYSLPDVSPGGSPWYYNLQQAIAAG